MEGAVSVDILVEMVKGEYKEGLGNFRFDLDYIYLVCLDVKKEIF